MLEVKESKTAILMCTCTAYTPIAKASCELIDVYWLNHPEIFIVGGEAIHNLSSIPFACDEKDWIGMAYEATVWLRKHGFTHCYLILDDHPPVGKCNPEYLNRILPETADSCYASHVSLAGWDQLQPKDGDMVRVGSQRWMRNNVFFKWKFDLHPGFWNVSSLMIILDKVKDISPRIYSAREFEGAGGSEELLLPEKIVKSTFKIEGDFNAQGNRWFQRRAGRSIVLYSLHVLRLVARLGGKKTLDNVDDRTSVYTQYINGPYPMYWSGVIKKGSLNSNLVKFAETTKNQVLLEWLETFEWSQGN